MEDKEIIKEWLKITDETIETIRLEDEPFSADVNGTNIIILPNVFSPKHFADVEFFSKEIPKIVGNGSLLEIGVGTGVVSLFAALNGASKVVGTDINPEALKNTNKNFEKYGLTVELILSDVFDSVPTNKKFDYIFWNHPFNFSEEKVEDLLLRSVYDTEFNGLKKFFKGAQNYLNTDGVLVLGTGDLADQDTVINIAKENGWKLFEVKESKSTHRDHKSTSMGLYIYQFTRQY